MSVTEAQRHHLYESLKSHLGPAEAETFMNLMPPTDWSEVATKSDIAGLRAELKSDMADLRGEFGELRGEFAELRGEFAELRGEFHGELGGIRADIADLRAEFKSDLADMRNDMMKTFGTWLFASQAAVIVAFGVISAIMMAVVT